MKKSTGKWIIIFLWTCLRGVVEIHNELKPTFPLLLLMATFYHYYSLASRSRWFLQPFLNYSMFSQPRRLVRVERPSLWKVVLSSVSAGYWLNPVWIHICLKSFAKRGKETANTFEHPDWWMDGWILTFLLELWSP